MSRRDQQPELDCWLAPEAADGGNGGEGKDDEEYDIPDSSLSIATTPTTSRLPAVLAAAGAGNSCGHNSAFSLLRNRVAAQVQESVSRVKSRLGRVMRRRPRYCSTVCSRRLLLNYRHLPSTASVTSRRTQSADDSTTFSQRSDVYKEDYFEWEGSKSSHTVATASVSIDLSTKPPQFFHQQQLTHNLQNTSYTCTSSGYLPKSNIHNIQNIQPSMPKSIVGSAWGDTAEPRVAPGAGKTTHGHRRVYAPEFCLLANRSWGSSDVKNSPGDVRRRIYLPPDALRSMANLSVGGQKPQPLSHQTMRRINTSEVIEVTVYAETSEEDVTWPVPLAMNSSSAQDPSQPAISRPPGGTNDGGGGDGGGGGGGGGCCGCGGKAKVRQSAIRQDPLPELSEPVTGQPSSSDAKKLESDTVESEGDLSTMSIVVDSNLAPAPKADENTRDEEDESSISTTNDWIIEVGEGAQIKEIAASTTLTAANWRRNSQQLPPLPEETMGEGAAVIKTSTPIPTETTTEEEEDSAPPARVPSKRPSSKCECKVETLLHPRASMESRKPALALPETRQSAEPFPALPKQVLIPPTPRQDAGPQTDQHPVVPQPDQPTLTQSHQVSVPQSSQPCVPQFHKKRSVPPPCRPSDLIATSHLPSEVLESNSLPSRSSDFEKYQQVCRLNSEVIQPQNAFRHSSPLRAHCKPSKILMPPQVSCKTSHQRTQSTPMQCKPSVLVVPPEVHADVNRTKSVESKSTNSQASCETSWKATITRGIDNNSTSSSFVTQELEISLIIDGDTRKECMQAFGTSQCTISSSLVLDTDTSDTASAIYDLHVGTEDPSIMRESDSGTVIEEVGGDNRSLSTTTESDSLNEEIVNERMYQTSQLSTGSDVSIEEVHVGCNRLTGKSLSQALDMANRSKSSVKYEVSRCSTESDEISIEEVHVGCNRLTGKSLSQALDMTNRSKSSVKKYEASRNSTESDDMSIEEVHVGYNRATSLNEGLNKINHSVMSSRNNKAHSSSTNTCTSERADRIPPASFTVIENSSVDATSLNWNATNSYAVPTECLTIRPAVYTRTDAVLTEVDLPVARQTCSVCQVASLPTVNHTHDQGSSHNDPATTSQPTVSTASIKLSKLNRSCNINEHDAHDTDESSVVFQLASRVEDESSGDNALSVVRDRPVVEVYDDDDADWVWQQRQICLIQTPPLVLQAKTVPCGPAREERRVSHRLMRIHQYLMPTKIAPAEYAAFKGTVSWLADCHLVNFVQPKGDVLLSVAGYRPVSSKVHHVPDRSLKLATTAPLQLLRNDTGGLMTSATVAAAVRGVAACECSTGSVAPMLSTKFSTVETTGAPGTATMRRRVNNLNASNNAEGRGALSKRLLTSWLRQQTAAAAVASAADRCQKPLSTISPPLFSPPQFAQIAYSSGESRWLCLTKPRDCRQQEEQQCPVELGTREANSRSESLSINNNWEASTSDTNNNNRDNSTMIPRQWRPPPPSTLHQSTTLLIQETCGRLGAAAVASDVAVQAAAASIVGESSGEVAIVTAVANAAAAICDNASVIRQARKAQLLRPERLRASRTLRRSSNASHLLGDMDQTLASFLWWSLVPLTSSDS